MNPHYTYMLVNLGCISVPMIFSFHPRLNFYKQWTNFILPCTVVAFMFLAWDILFTSWNVWHFNPEFVLGGFLWGLPVEEYLFFFCVPFASVFSYHAFVSIFQFMKANIIVNMVYVLLAICLFAVAIYHRELLYTATTFFFLSITLLFLLWRKSGFLPAFLACYLFILIPFTISNGILTGSFFGRTVVYYNDYENLGIRFLTIPLEDFFYGMLLLVLNVFGFEFMRSRRPVKGEIRS